ncbi:hypothetical protein Tco_0094807, partial [Tanacetum coccineum]
MSARDKTGLGYSTQLNELSSNHETNSENSLSIFDGRSSDDEHIPKHDRFSKNGYKDVPPPITGNFLTPRADISFVGLDEYAIRNKIIKSQTNDTNTVKPKLSSESIVSNPKINRDNVIIKDWTSDDEEEVSGVQKSQESNLKNVVNTGVSSRTGLHRPVCTARPSINTARHVSTVRPSISTARPVSTTRPSISTARPDCTARPSVSTARPSVSTARPVYASRSIYLRMDN